jgi:hypothetical protein
MFTIRHRLAYGWAARLCSIMEDRSASQRQGVPWRCLLLVPRGFDVPHGLVRCLYTKNFDVQTVSDAPQVMLELSGDDYLSVIVHEPDGLIDSAALAVAIRRFHPGVLLWQYRVADDPSLRRFGDSAPVRSARPLPKPVVEATELPTLKLQRPPDPAPILDSVVSSGLPEPVVEITDEELAMLLGSGDLFEGTES